MLHRLCSFYCALGPNDTGCQPCRSALPAARRCTIRLDADDFHVLRHAASGAMAQLIQIEARAGYRVVLAFDDGVEGEIDLSARLFGPMFEPLKDPALFAAVRIDEFGAPCWPNGADLAPDAMYALLRAAPGSARLQSR